jgi:hypothetical protein
VNCYEELQFLKETSAQLGAMVDAPDLPLKVRAELAKLASTTELDAARLEARIGEKAQNNTKAS